MFHKGCLWIHVCCIDYPWQCAQCMNTSLLGPKGFDVDKRWIKFPWTTCFLIYSYAIPYNEAPTLPFFLTNSNILSTLGAGILGSNHITFALALKEMGKGNSSFRSHCFKDHLFQTTISSLTINAAGRWKILRYKLTTGSCVDKDAKESVANQGVW